MKTRLTLIGTMAVACAAFQLAAMPTKEEVRRAEQDVKERLASERTAFKSGRMTRSEVATAAMQLADKADTDAAKLLLMKGAFVLYVKDGNLEKAVETMSALEAAIADMPPQSITNMIETALLGVSKKEDGARLYKMLGEAKMESTTEKTRKDIAKLFPGWSLDSEVPQESRKDRCSGFRASHRGQNNIIRLHPMNRGTPVVLSRTITLSNKNPCLLLKVASWDAVSDFLLSVRVNGKYAMPDRLVRTSDLEPWEDLVVPLFDWRGLSVKIEIILSANNWWCEWSHLARIEIAEGNGREKCGLAGIEDATSDVDGFTWSYRVKNGEATIVAEKDGKHSCAVSPKPTGSISIPTSLGGFKVKGIGEHAFFGCAGLSSVTIPSGVKRIYHGAFYFCRGIKSFKISSSVTDIEATAFTACRGVQSFSVDLSNPSYSSRNELLCSKDGSMLLAGVNGDVTIPAGVVTIGRQAFLGRGLQMTVVIPSSVKSIEERAFAYCPELTSVTMCGERPEAPDDIFQNSGKLKSIHVPANAKSWAGMKTWQGIPLVFDQEEIVERNRRDEPVSEAKKTYGGYTWSYRERNGEATLVAEKDGKYSCAVSPNPTGEVSIPPTLNGVKVTRIGRDAFRCCKEITSVTIPEGVTHIDIRAFDQCYGLKSVTLPSSLKVIGFAAFGKCAGLTSVVIPEGVTSINNDAFNGCSGLTSVVIPNSVTHIGERAFLGCQELMSVTIPAKVASIGEGAFVWGSKLKQINLAADNQSFTLVDGVLYKKDMSVLLACLGDTTAVTIPSGVTKIGAFAFRGCTRLKSVTIPEGVTDIGWVAFVNCVGLKSLTIPESVKVVGPAAFKDCVELDSVTMRGERPEAPNDIFMGCGKLKSIHVPANAKSWAGMKEWQGIPLVFDAK